MQRVGILGSGQVAQTLAKGFKKHGYEVRIGSRTPDKLASFAAAEGIASGTFSDVAAWAEMVVLAVVGRAAEEALLIAGRAHLKGKVVIDTTNPIADEPPVDGVLRYFTGPNSSLFETLQAAFPDVKLVKAFNSVGNALMVDPVLPGGKPTMFICGDDKKAKEEVTRILDRFGWETADMGTQVAARAIEPLCQLWCIRGFRENQWVHAFRLLRA